MKNHSIISLVRAYIDHRRKLGFELNEAAYHLPKFARYADRTAPGQPLTSALAMEWAALPGDNRLGYHAKRLKVVRGFARYCAALDPRTEIPPPRVFGPQSFRRAPHIYSKAEVRLLLTRARRLRCIKSSCALRPFTYETMIGLLYCTGLRRVEVLRLRLSGFDPKAGTLLVPAAKSSPQRLLPLHASVVRCLQRYLMVRQRLVPFGDHFFVGLRGRPIPAATLNLTFRRLAEGMVGNGARAQPRIADFRHSFATRLIAGWGRRAKPVPHYLLLLSRYMGHKYFNQTWWYVTPDCTALNTAAARFQNFQDTQFHPDTF
jgi:integrase